MPESAPGSDAAAPRVFATTHWSVVLATRQDDSLPVTTNNTRIAEITYPDGSRKRIESPILEFQCPSRLPLIPSGIQTFNNFHYGRNTYY